MAGKLCYADAESEEATGPRDPREIQQHSSESKADLEVPGISKPC